MDFFIGNQKDLAKVSREFADFFLEILKIHRLVWSFLLIFGCFESVSSMFFIIIINFKFDNAVLSKTICIIGRCLVHQKRT